MKHNLGAHRAAEMSSAKPFHTPEAGHEAVVHSAVAPVIAVAYSSEVRPDVRPHPTPLTINVSTVAGVLAAITTIATAGNSPSTSPGGTIVLAAGVYSGLLLNNVNIPAGITLTSADPNNTAVLTDLNVTNSSNLTFNALELSTIGSSGKFSPKTVFPFQISSCDSITLTNLYVHGDPLGTLDTTTSALSIRDTTNIAVLNSHFQYIHHAISDLDDRFMTIKGNSFDHIYDDAIRGGGTSDALVTQNTFTTFHMDLTDEDHPDCIQWWTTGTTQSVSNITITNNTFTRGDGNPVQGVFFRDQVGNIPFLNVTVSGNSFTGANYNGIELGHVIGLSITNNVVVSYPDRTSWIGVQDSTNGVISGNQAIRFQDVNNTNVVFTNNMLNQPVNPSGMRLAHLAASLGGGAGAAAAVAHSAMSPRLSLLAHPLA